MLFMPYDMFKTTETHFGNLKQGAIKFNSTKVLNT